MKPSLRSLLGASLIAGACMLSTSTPATAQGNSHKAQKVERKIDHRIAKAEVRREEVRRAEVRRARLAARTNRARVLCDDGTWSYASVGCGGHGGLASRQYHAVPRASARAIERANEHSAVARAYANGVSASAIARCNDGTFWHAMNRTNACYRHGGVARWF